VSRFFYPNKRFLFVAKIGGHCGGWVTVFDPLAVFAEPCVFVAADENKN
jgi:hypothetical protein